MLVHLREIRVPTFGNESWLQDFEHETLESKVRTMADMSGWMVAG